MTTTVASIATAVLASLATWIVHLIWPRTAPATNAATTAGATVLPGINIAMKAESAGLSWLVPLLKALETANGPLIQVEARFLHRLVEQQGGFANLIDGAVDQVLESRLAAGKAKWLVRFATDGGITPRELLDELEGKPAAIATSSSVVPAAAALLLCLCLAGTATAAFPVGQNFAAGPSHWHADVHAPQAFYPTELNLVSEPKVIAEQPHGQQAYPVSTGAVYSPDGSCDGSCQQGGYWQTEYVTYRNANGFMQRGPVRRWVANGGPVRNWVRNGNHPVVRFAFAPFRWLFRGRR